MLESSPRLRTCLSNWNHALSPSRKFAPRQESIGAMDVGPGYSARARCEESRRHAGCSRRMLQITARFSFSPLALQASLRTSIFQARNRTTGTAMSLIKKSDVKNHLSPQFRTKIHLCEPVSPPDAIGCAVPETGAIEAISANFAEDFVTEHSSSSAVLAPSDPVTGGIGPQAAPALKSAQA